MNVLAINAGSSSLKFALYEPGNDASLVEGVADWGGHQEGGAKLTVQRRGEKPAESPIDAKDHGQAVTAIIRALPHGMSVDAVGHRVVHGGPKFRKPVRLDETVKAEIDRLSELAPLHNPAALRAIAEAEAALPGVPQAAAFDTSFFSVLPREEVVYPVPWQWYEEWGVRRFGFHGISHEYCAGRAAAMLGDRGHPLRLVVCHLGNGCSASAIVGGAAVATTMGFTPMEGLMMGTRSGSIDPGVFLYVQSRRGVSVADLDDALNRKSGLLGVSGISSDFRNVEREAGNGNDRARLAFDCFARSVASAVGSLFVVAGGIDALVFTAGIGQHSPGLRAAVVLRVSCLGVAIDGAANANCKGDADISTSGSSPRTLVIHTREELKIARETERLLGDVKARV